MYTMRKGIKLMDETPFKHECQEVNFYYLAYIHIETIEKNKKILKGRTIKILKYAQYSSRDHLIGV